MKQRGQLDETFGGFYIAVAYLLHHRASDRRSDLSDIADHNDRLDSSNNLGGIRVKSV